jgi:quercetin dioxygenase-like cupin family protein
MIGTRFAGGLLAAGMVATAAACVSAPEPPGGMAATVSKSTSETLSPLLENALPNVDGKTFTSALVDLPPAARIAPHRHGEAFVYAYVLDGSVRSQVDGEPMRTYRQGENWVEQPGAHHVLTENPSTKAPAKLLVIFISNTRDQLKVDDPHQ